MQKRTTLTSLARLERVGLILCVIFVNELRGLRAQFLLYLHLDLGSAVIVRLVFNEGSSFFGWAGRVL